VSDPVDPKHAALAYEAVAMCNDALNQWIAATRDQPGAPLTCALAAQLMPRVLAVFLREHGVDPVQVEGMLELAAEMADHCGLSAREVKGGAS
jgi:hypothetical protein